MHIAWLTPRYVPAAQGVQVLTMSPLKCPTGHDWSFTLGVLLLSPETQFLFSGGKLTSLTTVPALHSKHLPFFEYSLLSQGTQRADPALNFSPQGHATHDVCPTPFWKVLAGNAMQEDVPLLVANCPIGHCVHEVAKDAWERCVPAMQLSHVLAWVLRYRPGAHLQKSVRGVKGLEQAQRLPRKS
jgi:hypothetical protein